MRRIWLDAQSLGYTSLDVGAEIVLPEETFRHAVQVSRFARGDSFEAITGGAKAYVITLLEVGKKSASAKVMSTRNLPAQIKPELNLAFAISKFETTENVIEKCVELGVTQFWPLITQNSFIKNPNDLNSARLERWRRIIQSATTQTARGSLMQLKPAASLDEFVGAINRDESAACLFGYEGVCRHDIRGGLRQLLDKKPQSIWALVGSEGGFSKPEVEKLKDSRLEPVTMGPQILRAETACLAMVSVIKYEAGLMR